MTEQFPKCSNFNFSGKNLTILRYLLIVDFIKYEIIYLKISTKIYILDFLVSFAHISHDIWFYDLNFCVFYMKLV